MDTKIELKLKCLQIACKAYDIPFNHYNSELVQARENKSSDAAVQSKLEFATIGEDKIKAALKFAGELYEFINE